MPADAEAWPIRQRPLGTDRDPPFRRPAAFSGYVHVNNTFAKPTQVEERLQERLRISNRGGCGVSWIRTSDAAQERMRSISRHSERVRDQAPYA